MATRIMIAETEAEAARDLQVRLEGLGHEVVASVTSAAAALQRTEVETPDLVLMSVGVVEQDGGAEALQVLRAERLVPVVLVAAQNDEEHLRSSRTTVPCGYLHERYSDRELGLTIDTALSIHRADLDRRQSEEELAASRDRLLDLFDNAPIGYAITNADGRILESNRTLALMLGLEAVEIAGRLLYELAVEADRDACRSHLQDARTAGPPSKPSACELRLRHAGGEAIWARLETTPSSTRTPALRTAISDVTDRRRVQERIRFQAQLLRAVGQAVIATDRAGAVTYWNRAAEELYGWEAGEAKGRQIMELTVPHPSQEQAQAIMAALAGGDSWSGEFTVQHKDGSRFPVLIINTPVLDDDGDMIGIIGVSSDISERTRAERALQQREADFRTMIEVGQDVFIRYDLDLRYRYVSPSIEIYMDARPEDFIGKTHREFGFSEEQARFFDERLLEVIATKKSVKVEFSMPDRNDTELHLAAVAYPELDQQGQVQAVVTVTRDLTDRRRFEEMLKDQQRVLTDILESSLSGYWDWDIPAHTEYLSPTFKRMFGYEEHELSDSPESWQSLIVPDDLPRVMDSLDRHVASRGREPFRNEIRYRHKDGSTVWALCVGRVIEWADDGSAIRIVGCHVDITHRKQAEQALRASEEKYRQLFASMSLGASLNEIVCNEDGAAVDYLTLEVNESFERILGVRRQDVVGVWASEILPPAELELWLGHFGKVALEGKVEHWVTYSDHNQKYFEGTAFSPKPGQFVAMFADITARRRAEQEREDLQEQLAQAQKMESVGRLAGGVAHDFNNTLGVILGYLDLAQDELEATHPVTDYLVQITDAAERSAKLTSQLLAFARKQTVKPAVLDLNREIGRILKMLERLIGEQIALTWSPGTRVWPVKIDRSQLDQLLANLCVNARDAIDGPGTVTIATANRSLDAAYCARRASCTPGDYVLLSISDSGCGMPDEVRQHLFEPFFTTKPHGLGTGLGLSTVYGVVKQNDGAIEVESEPGTGSTFLIFLPRNRGEVAAAEVRAASTEVRHGHETVLLVEDEPQLLDLTTTMLGRLGYTVLSALSPGKAVSLAQAHAGPIHLLITDVVMPEMNGRDLATRILELHPMARLLFISGYTADVITDHGVLAEDVNFLQKPFTLEELAEAVGRTLA